MGIREPFISSPVTAGKTVVFGHTRTVKLHGQPTVWFGDGKIGIDGGCAFGDQLNALITHADGKREVFFVNSLRR